MTEGWSNGAQGHGACRDAEILATQQQAAQRRGGRCRRRLAESGAAALTLEQTKRSAAALQ